MSSANLIFFRCQTCHLPLIVNDSLLNLSTAQQRLLTSEKSINKKSKDAKQQLPKPEMRLADTNTDRMKMYNEAMQQCEGFPEVLQYNIPLGDDQEEDYDDDGELMETRGPMMSPKQLHAIEDKLLDQLSELQINIDDMDDEKLLEVISNLKRSNVDNQKTKTYDEDDDPTVALMNNINMNMNYDDFQDSGATISNRINMLSKMFGILSFKYDIDYPVCVECSDTLSGQLKQQYDEAIKEKNAYLQFLNKLNKQTSPNLGKLDSSLMELRKLDEKYIDSLKEIEELEKEEAELKAEIEEIDKEIANVNIKESDLLCRKNLYELELLELNDLNNQMSNSLLEKKEIYEKLKKSNVYNDVFNISYDGAFGTINDLRLGNLKNTKVSWAEINSALGQIVLLLSIIIKKLNLNIQGYKLVPMGSYSKIEKYEPMAYQTSSAGVNQTSSTGDGQYKKTILECFSSGSSTFERLFTHNSLDQAMIGLLNIIKQMEDELKEKYDKAIELPYPINIINNKIGGLNIKLNRKITDDEWTMACKFLVTNVKYILAFSSTKINNRK